MLPSLGANTPRGEPDVDLDDSLETLVRNFSGVVGELMSYTTTDWIRIDMSMAQVKVMMVLNYLGPHTIHQLAERLQIGAPTASQLVEKLVQAGYASRRESPSDRRRVEVHLTAQGRTLVNNLLGVKDRIIAAWIVQLPVEQRFALRDSLTALLTIIKNTSQEHR